MEATMFCAAINLCLNSIEYPLCLDPYDYSSFEVGKLMKGLAVVRPDENSPGFAFHPHENLLDHDRSSKFSLELTAFP